jgi:hypothetical protein
MKKSGGKPKFMPRGDWHMGKSGKKKSGKRLS